MHVSMRRTRPFTHRVVSAQSGNDALGGNAPAIHVRVLWGNAWDNVTTTAIKVCAPQLACWSETSVLEWNRDTDEVRQNVKAIFF